MTRRRVHSPFLPFPGCGVIRMKHLIGVLHFFLDGSPLENWFVRLRYFGQATGGLGVDSQRHGAVRQPLTSQCVADTASLRKSGSSLEAAQHRTANWRNTGIVAPVLIPHLLPERELTLGQATLATGPAGS